MSDKIEITVDQVTEDISIEVSPVGIQGEQGDKGDKGDPFTFSDFTPEQIESLKIKGDKGDAFTYSDFTPEQIEGLKVKGDRGDEGEKGDKGEPFTFEDLTHAQKAAAFNTFFSNYYDPAIVSLSARGTTFHRNLHQVQHELDKLEHKPTIYTDMSVTSEGKLHSVIPSDGSGDWTVDRNSEATYVDKDGLIKTAPPNTPRIDWSTGEPMLLVEKESRNLISWSEDLTKWSNTSGALVSVEGVSPDGISGASKITSTTNGGRSVISNHTEKVDDNQSVTASVFVKSGTSDWILINQLVKSGGQRSIFFNASTGEFGEVSSSYDKVKAHKLNNGWYKIISTINVGGSPNNTSPGMFIGPAGGSGIAETNSGDSIYVWGAQIEKDSIATSYIPTNGSTVTRLKERFFTQDISSLFPSKAFTIFLDFPKRIDSTGSKYSVKFIDKNNSEIQLYNNTNNLNWYFPNNGGYIWGSASAPNNSDPVVKIVLSYDGDALKFYINGVLQHAPFSTTELNGLSKVEFNMDKQVYNIDSLRLYPVPLSAEQSIALTTL